MSQPTTDIFAGVMGCFVICVICLIGFLIYFIPTFIAFRRNHYYKWIIFAINFVLGGTGIGYLVALVWAIWPSNTGLADPFINDPTSNSREANKEIYSRYGENRQSFAQPEVSKQIYIFVARENKQFGPYTVAQIRSMLQSQKITQSDFAWHEGLENWVAISSLRDFVKKTPPPNP